MTGVPGQRGVLFIAHSSHPCRDRLLCLVDLASSYLLLIIFEGAAEGCVSLLLLLYSILSEEAR